MIPLWLAKRCFQGSDPSNHEFFRALVGSSGEYHLDKKGWWFGRNGKSPKLGERAPNRAQPWPFDSVIRSGFKPLKTKAVFFTPTKTQVMKGFQGIVNHDKHVTTSHHLGKPTWTRGVKSDGDFGKFWKNRRVAGSCAVSSWRRVSFLSSGRDVPELSWDQYTTRWYTFEHVLSFSPGSLGK